MVRARLKHANVGLRALEWLLPSKKNALIKNKFLSRRLTIRGIVLRSVENERGAKLVIKFQYALDQLYSDFVQVQSRVSIILWPSRGLVTYLMIK